MINVKSLTVQTDVGQLLLDNISIVVPSGRITTIVGKSGAGKTTLLRTVAGLGSTEYRGVIEIDGKALASVQHNQRASLLGFVFQDFNLFENLNVLDNCVQPVAVVKKEDEHKARLRAVEILKGLSMDNALDKYPKHISGGQKQRVAIARALCMGSRTLLLDEPTSALDPENTANLVCILKRLCSQGMTILISSQDMNFVSMIVDRLYLLESGKIVEFFDSDGSGILPKNSLLYAFLNF